ncbi:Protein of unknown function DUF4078 [Penicillium bovifimosum]|uniref:Uncharacterized protein n=1 Tax=Penicillium bovifimosum TaxID=126998 RepID=A0A9W9H2I5_9EURO|nr:Protein of unknown function DUF4078 [Penicillium bovifimosum]KAJ5135578.1 Protein of unknown function DUF4078 [Penicillium bovifimosum]
MPADQGSLYGQARSKKKAEVRASDLAFSSQLSSLIAQDSTSASSRGRQRPSKHPKPDIFSKHNKGAQKRAATDLTDDSRATKQVHLSSQDIGSIDANTLGRSRRRMEEKVRIYEDMKKGLHLAGDSDDDDIPTDPNSQEAYLVRLRRKEKDALVDFDLKHTEEQHIGDDEDDDSASIVSYEDEFGRSRRGTRAEAREAARAKDEEAGGGQERWRPARPDNLIYGEAIQTEAFNPEANIAAQMTKLAARRDRSPTPPENKHYDAAGEVRNRGTGFYTFSTNEDERKKQMEELEAARLHTLFKRQTDEERAAARKAYEQWRRDELKKEHENYKEKQRWWQAEIEKDPEKAKPTPRTELPRRWMYGPPGTPLPEVNYKGYMWWRYKVEVTPEPEGLPDSSS